MPISADLCERIICPACRAHVNTAGDGSSWQCVSCQRVYPACAEQMPNTFDLLPDLICPSCRAALELRADGSGLRCVSCHRLYPVRDDIPVMLIDEAVIDE